MAIEQITMLFMGKLWKIHVISMTILEHHHAIPKSHVISIYFTMTIFCSFSAQESSMKLAARGGASTALMQCAAHVASRLQEMSITPQEARLRMSWGS